MEIISVFFNNIKVFFATLDPMVYGGIILGLLLSALMLFLNSTKGAKKDKFIKNYFTFYLSILFTVFALILTLVTSF